MKSTSKVILLTVLVGLQGCYDQESKRKYRDMSTIKKQKTAPVTKDTRVDNEHIPLKGDLLQIIYVSSF